MKTLITVIACVFALAIQAQNELTINIKGLSNNEGSVMISVLDESGKSVSDQQLNIQNKTCTLKVEELKSGTYAVRYFHDENSNGDLDTGMFGIPKEGYGFSNDARGMMGPPDFEDMLFKIDSDLSITLNTVN